MRGRGPRIWAMFHWYPGIISVDWNNGRAIWTQMSIPVCHTGIGKGQLACCNTIPIPQGLKVEHVKSSPHSLLKMQISQVSQQRLWFRRCGVQMQSLLTTGRVLIGSHSDWLRLETDSYQCSGDILVQDIFDENYDQISGLAIKPPCLLL